MITEKIDKPIQLNEENHKKVMRIKIEKGYKQANEVITFIWLILKEFSEKGKLKNPQDINLIADVTKGL